MKSFICNQCEKSFKVNSKLTRHVKSVHKKEMNFECEKCKKKFGRKDNLKEHYKLVDCKRSESDFMSTTTVPITTTTVSSTIPRAPITTTTVSSAIPTAPSTLTVKPTTSAAAVVSTIYCNACSRNVERKHWFYHQRTNDHKRNGSTTTAGIFKLMKSGFSKRISSHYYENSNETELRGDHVLEGAHDSIFELLTEKLNEHTAIKFNMELFGEYVKMNDETATIDIKSHQTKMKPVLDSSEIENILCDMYYDILVKMSEFQERDSGWSLIKILHIEININKYQPLRGSNYIPLPNTLLKKKACINVQNNDEFCFKWAILSALKKVDHPQRCSSYQIINIRGNFIELDDKCSILNFNGLSFPLIVRDIKKFEDQNVRISINVFGFDEELNKVVGPYYITKLEKVHHINLLLLQKEDRSHYVWIKDMSRLIMQQMTLHNHKIFVCNACLQTTHLEIEMVKHKEECGKVVSEMVSEKNVILKFKNYERRMDVPVVVYADFECILAEDKKQISEGVRNIQRHDPCAFSYYINCNFNSNLNKLVVYSGEKVSENFVEKLTNDLLEIYNDYLSKIIPINSLTAEEFTRQLTENCHICDGDFINDEKRVVDHCHLTGQYRGPAHNSCNLKYQIPSFVPIFFHNFTSYDCHLFIKNLTIIPGDIKVIPLNKEKYISLSKIIKVNEKQNIELRFLDSFRFMASSLDELAKNLDIKDLKVTRSIYPEISKFELICKKGIFPYDYLNNDDKLNDQQLPEREKFFNKLTNSECSVDDYVHAQKVWYTFNCRTLRDYMEVYLKTDVLLLTDVFENFRKICKNIHKLDPCQYYTTPGLSWDAMLLSTKIELELLRDITMHTFIQRGIRGGLVQCSLRHSVANNKYMSNYDINKPSQFLMYVDANNLYGWAMSENLPYGGFNWVENINNFDISSINSSSSIGYILEVDLEYPQHLHDLHNDLPFCPENKKMKKGSQIKLIADLNSKTKYIILDRHLKQCLENGMVIKKIHRILQFKQSPWLKKYIDLNNHHRTQAKNAFEKNFFKLLNNAVYGKTMENVDKRKDVKIVTDWESKGRHLGARALIAKPNFHSVSQFCEDMYAIQMSRVHTIYNKPLYLGFCVLELSKLKMYNFHYSYMKPKYGDKVELNYMDTDSFIYTIRTNDFYHDIKPDIKDYFDTSEYPNNNQYNITLQNKKVLGMMKDENNGQIMTEFVGLRSKMYSLSVENGGEVKKSKGVKKSALTKLTINNYKDCLLQRKVLYDSMFMFRSYAHKLYTQEFKKIVLSYADDKRYIRENGINTFAWGHYKIRETFSPSK